MNKLTNTQILYIAIATGLVALGGVGFLFRDAISSQVQRVTGTLPQLVGDEVSTADMLDAQQLVYSDDSTLSEEEIAGLLQMREEEKLAHDVYVTLGDYWKQQVFTNIAGSEQTHTDAVAALLSQYGVADPAKTGVGQFTDPELQKLYDALVSRGKKSLAEALQVGALIEDLDINDLNKLLTQTTNSNIQRVYENLLRGSKNHLRSFTRVIQTNGGTYKPAYIDQQLYEEILQGTTGNGRQGGRWGRRRG